MRLVRLVCLLFALLLPSLALAAGPTFTQGLTSNGQTFLNFGAKWTGSLFINAIPDPSAPVVTVNTTGSATHTYYIVGHDGADNCGGNEGKSNVSPGTTVTNSATPANNSVALPTTYLFYDVLRDATNTSIATCVAGGSTVVDTGQASSAYTPPASNTTNTINNAVFTNLNVGSLTVTTANVTTATVTTGTVTTAKVTTLNNTSTPVSTNAHINEPNANIIVGARNAANNGDLPVLSSDALNDVVLGGSGVTNINTQNPVSLLEQGAPSGVANRDVLWGDSTSHSLRFSGNNGASQYLLYSSAIPTTNFLPKANATFGQFSNSSVQDNGTLVIAGEPLSLTEQTAPTASSGSDICWGDSTAHALKCNFNNAGNLQMMAFSGAFVSGHCPQSSVSGGLTTFVDSGASCAAATAPALWIGTSTGIQSPGAATAYIGFGQSYDLAIRTSEANAFSMLPSANGSVTLKNLFCSWPTVAANLVTAVVRDTHTGVSSSTTLTCNSAGTGSCNDTADTPTVAGGDLLDIKLTTTDNAHSTGNVSCGFQITGA